MVEDVPDHAEPGPPADLEGVLESEDAVVVLDHEPRTGPLRKSLKGPQEAQLPRFVSALAAADVQNDHGFWTQTHRVEQPRLQLQVSGRRFAHPLGSRVEDDVLTWMARQAHVELVRVGAHLRELLGAIVDLSVELRQLRMGAVGDERGRQAIHADLHAREILEDLAQPLERDAQVRLRLPTTGVVRGQPRFAHHLHGEPQLPARHHTPPKVDPRRRPRAPATRDDVGRTHLVVSWRDTSSCPPAASGREVDRAVRGPAFATTVASSVRAVRVARVLAASGCWPPPYDRADEASLVGCAC
jgi:hypothetical protein